MGLLRAADTFFALRFLRLLTTPWEKTGAYKKGIVDKNGAVIKKPKTGEEKAVYNIFHKLVFNLKRLLNKLPFGKKTIVSYATALFLIKEHTGMSEELMSELLYEATGFNPLDDMIELEEGLSDYQYNPFILFSTGEMISNNKSTIIPINESSARPIGSIFNIPIYKVKELRTNQHILVAGSNIKNNK